MKNIIKTIFILLFSLSSVTVAMAQEEFSAFEKNKQVNSVIVNQKMFEMMANVKVEPTNEEEKAYLNLIKKLTSLKVFNTISSDVEADMKTAVTKYINTASLKELSNNKDNEANVTIYVDQNGSTNNISKLLMFNESSTAGKENIVMIMTGQFSIKEISALTTKMNLPLGNTLNKIK